MPKGRQKGGRRQFTDFEAESEKKEREEKEARWRARRGELPSEDEAAKAGGSSDGSSSESDTSSESEEEEVKQIKPKGVSGLIEFENPNRQVKSSQKVTSLNTETDGATAQPQLSRREREELEKQRATAHYRKLHAAGKTEEARADLERLALIRQKRTEAEEKKREQKEAKAAAALTASAAKGTKKKS